LGLTTEEIASFYWGVKGFKVNISVIDMNFDAFTQFLLGGGSSGSIIGSLGGLASAQQSLSQSPVSSINGRTKVFSAYQRKNRVCKETDDDEGFKYDSYGNIVEIGNCDRLKIKKSFVAADLDVDESRLCVAGPIHSLSSKNGQGYVQMDFSDIIYSNRLYWPVIKIFIGNGQVVLTSDIMSPLGINQNAYNIGAVNFCGRGTISMSGYSVLSFQPIFYSVGGSISIGERCCDKFYYDGIDRESADDPCYAECIFDDEYDELPTGGEIGKFVGGGGDSGGGGAGGSFDW
jgi:hypothetical protein